MSQSAKDLGVVIGYAGTGKSAMLGVARDAWENAGLPRQRCGAVGDCRRESGERIGHRVAHDREHGASMGAGERTAHYPRHPRRRRGRHDRHAPARARAVGRKPRRVAPSWCWSATPSSSRRSRPGAAFRSLAERHGAVEITEVRRQREDVAAAMPPGRWRRAGPTEPIRSLCPGAGHGPRRRDTREAARAGLDRPLGSRAAVSA